MLTNHLLDFAGVKALAGGNLGDSFARLLLDEDPADVYVLELSSFQLDGMVTFRPSIATVLNITPDHLDRYGYSLEAYANSKVSIAKNQRLADRLLVLADQQTIAPALRRNKTDAKITTISDEDFALEAMTGPTVWIAGGTDKGNDYDVLLPLVTENVHTLICMGLDNEKLVEAFAGKVENLYECRSAAAAVTFANQLAKKGDTVLMSPACASFDLFKNYIDRGDQFRAAVKNLNA